MAGRVACALLTIVLACSMVCVPAPSAEAAGIGPGEKIELRDMLNKGLKARRKVEFQFTNKVVDLTAQGILPETMVKETFQWARRKYRHRYVYFQNALKRRAKKELKISL